MSPYEDEREVVFMMTEACNSNCIMCPMSSDQRRRGIALTEEEAKSVMDAIDGLTEHIDITGGEPFLNAELVLDSMRQLNERWPQIPVQVLTNGRALCIPRIQSELAPLLTSRYRFAIPLHAGSAALHDAITQAPGSFEQTMRGIEFLSGEPVQIEIRVVGHRENLEHLNELCDTLLGSGLRISVVNFIAMEMNGSAARNRERLWVDYRTFFEAAKPVIRRLVHAGIDVGLYDFPLCAVGKAYWPLAMKSISEWKVRYPQACNACDEKRACGGLFRSTFLLGLFPVHPICQAKEAEAALDARRTPPILCHIKDE